MSDSDSRKPTGTSTSVSGANGPPVSGANGPPPGGQPPTPSDPEGEATTPLGASATPTEPGQGQDADRAWQGQGLGPGRDREREAGWSSVSSWGPGGTGASREGAGSGGEPADPASGAPGPAFAWGAPSTASPWGQDETRPIPEPSGAGPGWGAPPPGSGQRPPGGRRTSRLVAGALVVLLLIGAGFGLGQLRDRGSNAGTAASGGAGIPVTVTPSRINAGEEPVAAVAKALLPSVVQIETQQGLGSGVIYDKHGYILTAAHVVDQAGGQITVRLADGTKLSARLLGTDQGTDIAVLKVDRNDLKPAALARNVAPQVGQLAVAIGSPFGLEGSVTSGVVSAVNRSLSANGNVFEVIQTDAPINPGNSGGALADRQGRVIGINDSIKSESGGNEGIGFAVPIDIAAASATRIVQGKSTQTGYLGVGGTDPTLGRAGALINEVVPGGPADKAGLQVGDLVVSINGKQVQGMDDLAAQVRLLGAGQRAQLTVVRDGKEQTVTATLTNRPNE